MGALATLGTGSGAYEGLKELLAQRLQQAQFAEQQRQALSRESLSARELDETAGLRRQTQQQLEQERLRDEQYRRDALAQQKELSLKQIAQSQEAQAGVERRHHEGLDLRKHLAGEANKRIVSLANARRAPKINPEYYKWIQTLPSTDKDPQTAIQKAMRYAPKGDDVQAITQAVREAYGMTARPTSADAPGSMSEQQKFLLREQLSEIDTLLEAGEIETGEWQALRGEILGELGAGKR